MIIFKDLFSDDELFTDTFKYKLVDDIYYHIEGKFVQQSENDDYDIGANPSAEEAEEGTQASVTTGIDVALANRLVEMSTDKSQYKKDIKVYVKNLLAKVAEKDSERANFLKNNLPKVVGEWIKEFDNITAYKGESMSVDGTYVLCKYPEGDCSIGCKIDVYVLKDALVEEKCVGLHVFNALCCLRIVKNCAQENLTVCFNFLNINWFCVLIKNWNLKHFKDFLLFKK